MARVGGLQGIAVLKPKDTPSEKSSMPLGAQRVSVNRISRGTQVAVMRLLHWNDQSQFLNGQRDMVLLHPAAPLLFRVSTVVVPTHPSKYQNSLNQDGGSSIEEVPGSTESTKGTKVLDCFQIDC